MSRHVAVPELRQAHISTTCRDGRTNRQPCGFQKTLHLEHVQTGSRPVKQWLALSTGRIGEYLDTGSIPQIVHRLDRSAPYQVLTHFRHTRPGDDLRRGHLAGQRWIRFTGARTSYQQKHHY